MHLLQHTIRAMHSNTQDELYRDPIFSQEVTLPASVHSSRKASTDITKKPKTGEPETVLIRVQSDVYPGDVEQAWKHQSKHPRAKMSLSTTTSKKLCQNRLTLSSKSLYRDSETSTYSSKAQLHLQQNNSRKSSAPETVLAIQKGALGTVDI